MYVTAHIISMLLTGVMALQDFRTRSISVWILVTAGILLVVSQTLISPWELIVRNTLSNSLILLLLFATITVWFSLKHGKRVKLADVYIGKGDILLLLIVAPAFAPFNFLLFFISGSIAALGIYGAINLIRPNADRLIPLAGILGINLLLFCAYELFSNGTFRLSEDVLINLVNSTSL